MIYFLALVLLTVLALYFNHKGNTQKHKFWFCVFAFIILFLISALRKNIGIDYFSYQNIFRDISATMPVNIGKYPIEAGYAWLNYLVFLLGGNFYWMIALCSLIIVGLAMISIYKNSEHVYFSTFLYVTMFFYFASFNLMRQFIAISFVMFSYSFLKERKILPYMAIILMASTFHTSSLIMIPMYFMLNWNINKKTLIGVFTFVGLTYVFLETIVKFVILEFMPVYEPYLGSSYFATGLSFKSLIVPASIFLAIFAFKKYILELNIKNKILTNAAFYGLIISLFQTKMNLFDRFPYYFNIFAIFSLPLLLDVMKNKKQRDLVAFILLGFGVWYCLYSFIQGYHGVLPYISIFN